jgi:hypothetical protein
MGKQIVNDDNIITISNIIIMSDNRNDNNE